MKTIEKFALVLKRGKNSYIPIEWTKLSINKVKNPNEYSLEDIDKFTTSISLYELLDSILKENFVEPTERMTSLEIIYYDNGNNRVLPEGLCFKEDKDYIDTNFITNYLMANLNDYQLTNTIYIHLNKIVNKGNEEFTEDFLKLISSIRYSSVIIKSREDKKIDALKEVMKDCLNNITYTEKRKLGMYIGKKLLNN